MSLAIISDEELLAIETLVRQAGQLLMERWPGRSANDVTSLAAKNKADGTPVSEADYASNRLLCEALNERYPNDYILSEESPIEKELLSAAARVWIIDPLDGTSSFLHGRDDFSVLVSLWVAGVATVGVMVFPARDICVCARRGAGVTVNGKPVSVSSSGTVGEGRVYIRNFECSRPSVASPMMDSGLALEKVAAGELDGAIIRMTTHQEWDLAAPIVAILEAGGRVSDEQGRPVVCGSGEIGFSYFIASNGVLHTDLMRLIPAI